MYLTGISNFIFFLAVHLDIILVNNQHDAQFFFMHVYFYFLHVSDSYVLIIRRINRINTISGIFHSGMHTRLLSTQSGIYQMSY